MREQIQPLVKNATSLGVVKTELFGILESIASAEETDRVGFVIGIISSDGDENVLKNLRRLENYTQAVRDNFGIAAFSAADVFDESLLYSLEEAKLEKEIREHRFKEFWRAILESGHITDVFTTPGWEKSHGARDEFDTATKK